MDGVHEAVQMLIKAIPLNLVLKEDSLNYQMKRQGLAALQKRFRERIGETPKRWKKIVREDYSIDEWNGR